MKSQQFRQLLEESFPDDIDTSNCDPGKTIRGSRVLDGQDPNGNAVSEGAAGDRMTGLAGEYELREELGSGGMGIVWRAHQKSLRRDVAVKRLRGELAEIAESKHAFLAEALAAGYLDHPNIVPVHDLLRTEDGDLALAMKCVGGTSWRDLLHPWNDETDARAAAYDLPGHIEVLIAVCHAVAFAHSHGILHRDIKPENVMVGEFGEVLVMDWGMAVAFDDRAGLGLPQGRLRTPHISTIDKASGTPGYLAPEMAEARGADMGPWTDVYLIGATLYEILTGKRPHRGKSLFEIVRAAARSTPPEFTSTVPTFLQDVCRRAMSRDIGDRYQTVESLRDDLKDWLRHRQSREVSDRADALLQPWQGRQLERRLEHDEDRVRAYGDLAEALAGYRQARLLWGGNIRAAEKERTTRVQYAKVALANGDFALARSQLDELEGTGVERLRQEADQGMVERDRAARRVRVLRRTVTAAGILIVFGLSVGFFLVIGEKRRADENAETAAANARTAESSAREATLNLEAARRNEALALTNAQRAREEATLKDRALEDARREKDRADHEAGEARRLAETARVARAEAEESARLAEQRATEASNALEAALDAQSASATESIRASRESEAKRRALEEARRLADVQLVRRHADRARSLLARGDELEMRSWLTRTTPVVERLDAHIDALLSMQESASPTPRSADFQKARIAQRRINGLRETLVSRSDAKLASTLRDEVRIFASVRKRLDDHGFEFESDDHRWSYEVLHELVADLEAFRAGPYAEVVKRVGSAGRAPRFGDAGDQVAAWKEATAAIRRSPSYKGLRLRPVAGLVPLGADPSSQLHEFLHVASHGGPIPVRDAGGELTVGPDTGIVLVLIPAGRARIGAERVVGSRPRDAAAEPDEGPPWDVRLAGFLIGKHELTQGQWQRLTGATPSRWRSGADGITARHPVESISWADAGQLAETGLLIPTEAQWEYAGRGGSSTPWASGATSVSLRGAANIADASHKKIEPDWAAESWDDGFARHAPVGSFAPNGFGLHDVHGNVAEWVRDGHAPYASIRSAAGDGERKTPDATMRGVRGGGFGSLSEDARSAARAARRPSYKDEWTGLRVSMALPR